MKSRFPEPCRGPIFGPRPNEFASWSHNERTVPTDKDQKKDPFWISDTLKWTFYFGCALTVGGLISLYFLYVQVNGLPSFGGSGIRAAECAQIRVFADRVAASKFVEYDKLRQQTVRDLVHCMNEGY